MIAELICFEAKVTKSVSVMEINWNSRQNLYLQWEISAENSTDLSL